MPVICPWGWDMWYPGTSIYCRDQSRCAASQWQTSLHCNDVSHWLGAYLDWSLILFMFCFCYCWAICNITLYSWLNYTQAVLSWWCHQMDTFSSLLAICVENSPVNSPHKGQWRGALMFSLIYARINSWINNLETGDLRRHRAHYDVIVMTVITWPISLQIFSIDIL